MSADRGAPSSYLAVQPGTPVLRADGTQVGTVLEVLSVPAEDVFDGIVASIGGERRFVDADQVAAIWERCVETTLSPEQAQSLPPPASGTAVFEVAPTRRG